MIDLLERAAPWLEVCPRCDAGEPVSCTCPEGDPRPLLVEALGQIARLRAVLADVPLDAEEMSSEIVRLRAELERAELGRAA